MGKRRKSRELALRCLYSLDYRSAENLTARLSEVKEGILDEAVAEFALELLAGVKEHKEFFDRLISQYATNWSLDRVAVIDRNILRLALYEMLEAEEKIPPAVCIDEAIELAKLYGTDDSYRFINGILNKVKEDLEAGRLTCPQKGP